MRLNLLKEVYRRTPQPIKRLFQVVPFSWRMGESYRQTLAFLKESQHWTIEKAMEYQVSQLRHILRHAYATVPYYKQMFDKLDFPVQRPFSFSDFERLPLLSRADVADNYNSLISSAYGALNSYEGMTGGTTGTSLRVLFDVKSHFVEWAYLHTMWAYIGYSPRYRRVALTGVPFQGDRKVTIKYDPFHNEVQLSTFDMDEPTLKMYAEAIAHFKPHFLYGFPSALTVLASFLTHMRQVPRGIKGVLCGSEQLTDAQVQLLEKTFGCRVYSWYGQTERVALAGECEHSRDYHLFFQYGYTELVDDRGGVIRGAGEPGEIVATGFINDAMPLIRYRTGDVGQYAEGQCRCGRPYRRLSSLVGRRKAEYLIDRAGEKILLSSINTQIPVFQDVRQMQFVQTEAGRFQLNIMAAPGITASSVKAIKSALAAQLGGRAEVEVALVPDLVRTSRGKVKPFLQALNCEDRLS